MADSPQRQEIVNSSITNSTVKLEQTTNNYIQQLPPTEKQWPARQRRLLEKMQDDIKWRLAYIDNREAMIPLTFAEQSEAVSGPELKLKQKLKTAEGKTEVTSRQVIDVFLLPEVGRKLLILGNPGAGKTTTLLQLADKLVAQALEVPGSAIPIIFELSAWKDEQKNFEDWLKVQLQKFHKRITTRESKELIEKELLLPLLDGLDELGIERQVKCIRAINKFVAEYSYPHVVVCCRHDEYQCARKKVGVELGELRGAILISPLSDEQIRNYLSHFALENLWKALQIEPDKSVMLGDELGKIGFLRMPLFLTIIATSYDGRPFRNKQEIIRIYINERLKVKTRKRERKLSQEKIWSYRLTDDEPSSQLTLHYCIWLARYLKRESQTEFTLGDLQPRCLYSAREYFLYLLLSCVASGCITVLLFYPGTPQTLAAFSFLTMFLMGFSFGLEAARGKIYVFYRFHLVALWKNRSYTFEALEESLKRIKSHPKIILLLISFLFTFSCFVAVRFSSYSAIAYVFGWVFPALAIGAVLPAFFSLAHSERKRGIRMNFGASEIAWNFLGSILSLLPVFLLAKSVNRLSDGLVFNSGVKSIFGAVEAWSWLDSFHVLQQAVFFSFLFGGGLEIIKHYSLRFVLAYYGHIPFRYVRFLNYCEERKLLQKIGGRYRFIHRELQDDFAAQ